MHKNMADSQNNHAEFKKLDLSPQKRAYTICHLYKTLENAN